ncbi:coenzyme F420-0:L-glutamate ligase [Candidatus Peregrinibacteria bacterium]|nr:coenzyme F420-0:L-glutamate ligase [Candidatus Peregrinibacteria bacterium]
MLLLPIHTRLLENGDDLISLLQKSTPVSDGDILIISSKAVATVEGAAIDLRQITPSNNAEKWSKACGRSAAFCQAVLDETKRLHGEVVGTCPGALLTELRPDGLTEGTIFAANTGLDQSNVADGFAIGWPRDPVASVRLLRAKLEESLRVARCALRDRVTNQRTNEQQASRIGVVLSDSSAPQRNGERRSLWETFADHH